MAEFKRGITVPFETAVSDLIGVQSLTKGGQASSITDEGKAVKMGAASYIVPTAGDEIDGFIRSVSGDTKNGDSTNGGYSFGSILVEGRVIARVGTDQGATAMARGDYVVMGAGQEALGTNTQAQWGSYAGTYSVAPGTAPSNTVVPPARVKTGTPAKKLWRCIEVVSGTGVSGDFVLLERD